MRKIKLFIYVLLACVSCDDIFEEDITDKEIILLFPPDESDFDGQSVDLIWKEDRDINGYRLNIVETMTSQLVLDTLVTSPRFRMLFDEGTYDWKVRGENFAYQSNYSDTKSFRIILSEDLTNQSVTLDSPPANIYTNNLVTLFTWEENNFASSYDFEILKNENQMITVFQVNTSELFSTVPEMVYTEDAIYTWKVKAVNEVSYSMTSERTILLDRVSPPIPVLSSPMDMEVLSNTTITFDWIVNADMGNIQSPTENFLEISSNINFDSFIAEISTTDTNFNYTFQDSGMYYYRVKTRDSAGNESEYSNPRSFQIL